MSDSLLQCIILCFGAFEYSAGTQHGRDVEQGDLVYSASQLTVIKKERVLVEGGGGGDHNRSRNSWQWEKHAWLCSESGLLQALKRAYIVFSALAT